MDIMKYLGMVCSYHIIYLILLYFGFLLKNTVIGLKNHFFEKYVNLIK